MIGKRNTKLEDELRWIASDIFKLCGSSETEFLSIGEQIQNFYSESLSIFERGNNALEELKTKSSGKEFAELEKTVKGLDEYLNNAKKGIESNSKTLGRIKNLIDESKKPLSDFNKLIRFLKVISTSIKIEAANLSRGKKGGESYFLHLADETLQQAAIIEEKSGIIFTKLSILEKDINKTQIVFADLEDQIDRKSKQTLENISSALMNFKEQQEKTTLSAKNISTLSTSISENIGELVSKLQFHDIVKQRLEHSAHVIDSISGKKDKKQQNGALLKLQAAQIIGSKDEIVKAVMNIKENLKAIADEVTMMVQEIEHLLFSLEKDDNTCVDSKNNVQKGCFLSILRDHIHSASNSLMEQKNISRSFAPRMKAMADALEDMSSSLKTVENIGEIIKKIALNATIKAAQIGKTGSSVNVLANEVRTLSENASVKTRHISKTLNAISLEAMGIRNESIKNESVSGDVTEILHRLVDISESMRNAQDNTVENFSVIEKSAFRLIENIRNTEKEITIHDFYTHKLDAFTQSINKIVHDYFGLPLSLSVNLTESDTFLKEIASSYTMESERLVHAAHLNENSDKIKENGSDLLKSTNTEGERTYDDESDNDSGFGDNVELF